MKKLDKNINRYHFILRSIAAIIIYVGYGFFLTVQDEGVQTLLIILKVMATLVVIIVVLWHVILPWFIYKLNGYEVTDEHILNVKGVLLRQTNLTPIKRIQHIEKRQGPLQILLKIATLRVFTSGSIDMIVGVSEDVCDALQKEINSKLLPKLESSEGFEDDI